MKRMTRAAVVCRLAVFMFSSTLTAQVSNDITPLVEILHHGSREQRSEAILALAKTGKAEAVAPLIQVLKSSDDQLRNSALMALQVLAPKAAEAVPALAEVRAGRDDDQSSRAEMILNTIGTPEARAALKAPLPPLDDQTMGTLIQRVMSDSKQEQDVQARKDAILTLSRRPANSPAAVPVLLALLRDRDPNIRYNTIFALGRLHAKESVPELIQVMKTEDAVLSPLAIRALASIRPEGEAIIPVLALQLHNTRRVERFLYGLLPSVFVHDWFYIFQTVSNNPVTVQRVQAPTGLGLFVSNPTAEKALQEALNDSDEEVRAAARSALDVHAAPPR